MKINLEIPDDFFDFIRSAADNSSLRADVIISEALTMFRWAVKEKLNGRDVFPSKTLNQIKKHVPTETV